MCNLEELKKMSLVTKIRLHHKYSAANGFVNRIMVDNFASLFNCTTVNQYSDKVTAPPQSVSDNWRMTVNVCIVFRPIEVLFMVFLYSGFRSPLSPLFCFIKEFVVMCVLCLCVGGIICGVSFVITVDPRYLDFAYLEQPLISK